MYIFYFIVTNHVDSIYYYLPFILFVEVQSLSSPNSQFWCIIDSQELCVSGVLSRTQSQPCTTLVALPETWRCRLILQGVKWCSSRRCRSSSWWIHFGLQGLLQLLRSLYCIDPRLHSSARVMSHYCRHLFWLAHSTLEHFDSAQCWSCYTGAWH